MEENNNTVYPHNIILEDRHELSISGVEQVGNFNENTVAVYTSKGLMTIKGSELNISRLNLEDGKVKIEGTIDSIYYSDKMHSGSKGRGVLGKMFK